MALKVGELFASFGIDTSGVDKELANLESKFNSVGKGLALGGAAMSAAVTAPLVNFGKDIYKTGTEFGQNMARVFATAGLDKSVAKDAEAMEALRAKAIEMGSTTQFTSAEAAEAFNYMAMAGWKSEQMLDGIAPVMNLAAASGEELGLVSDIVTDALTAFGLKAKDAGHFADILAAASTNANTNVGMLGDSFKYVAPLAGAMGFSAEDVALSLGLMANSGIKASQAGTSMRSIITRLVKPTKESAKAIKDLGIRTTDSSGKMLPLNEIIQQMRQSFAGLDEAQKGMYASMLAGQYSMSGLLALVNASDDDFESLMKAIYGCDGAAKQMAETALDSAAGDIVYFKSALDGLKINLWELVQGPFRSVIQQATEYVNAFNGMDKATQKSVLKTGVFAAAIGPAMMGLGGLVSAAPQVVKALALMNSPLGYVGIGLLALGAAAMDTDNSIGRTMESMASTIGKQSAKMTKYLAENSQDMAERAGNFLKSLRKSITSALPGVLDLGAEFVKTMMDGIAANITDIANIGTELVHQIAESVTQNAPELIPSALNLAKKLIFGMLDSIPKLITDIGNIAIAIGEALLTYDWAKTGKQLWEKLKEAFNAAVAAVTGLGDTIKEKFGAENWHDVGVKIWEKIKSGISATGDWIKQQVLGDEYTPDSTWLDVGKKLWDKIKEGIKTVSDWLKELVGFEPDTSWGDIGKAIWEKIKAGIKATGDWLKQQIGFTPDTTWGEVGKAVWEKIKAGIKATGDWLKGLVGFTPEASWSDVGKAVWEKIKAGIKETGDWIKSLAGFEPDASWADVGKAIWEKIKSGIKVTADWLTSLGTDLKAAVTGDLSKGVDIDASKIAIAVSNAATFVSNLAEKLLSHKVEATTAIATFVGNLADGIANWDGWANIGSSVSSIASTLIDKIAEAIPKLAEGAGNAINGGFKIATAILDGITQGFGATEGTSIVDKLKSVGTSLIDGILGGIGNLDENGQISGFISKLGDALRNGMTNLGDILGTLVAHILSPEGLSEVWDAGVAIAKLLLQGVWSIFESGFNLVGSFLFKVTEGIKHSIEEALGLGGATTVQVNGVTINLDDITPEIITTENAKATLIATLAQHFKGSMDGVLPEAMQRAVTELLDSPMNTTLVNLDTVWEKILKFDATGNEETIRSIFEATFRELGFDLMDIVGDEFYAALANPEFNDDGTISDDWFNALIQPILDSLMQQAEQGNEEVSEASAEAGKAAGEQAKEAAINATIDGFNSGSTDAGTGDGGWLANAVKDAPKKALDAMTKTFTDGVSDVEAAAQAPADAAVNAFLLTMSEENGTTIAETFLAAMEAAIAAHEGTLQTASDSAANAAKNAFEAVLTADAGAAIGNAFGDAIVSAIEDAASRVSAQVDGILATVNSAQAAVREAAELINMPAVGGRNNGGNQSGNQNGLSGLSADQVTNAIRDGMAGVTVQMDGDRVGNLVTGQVNRNVAALAELR